MKSSSKKILINFSLVLIIISLVLLILYITYYYSVNKTYKAYNKNINLIIDKTISVNDSITDSYDSNTFDTETISDNLNSKIKQLKQIKSDLSKLNPTEKYQNSFNYLNNGLYYNIKLYNFIYNFLNNPLNNTEYYVNEIKNSRDTCTENYSKFSYSNNSEIYLSNETLAFIEDSINYAHKKVREQNDKDIIKSQLTEFQDYIDNSLGEFSSIKNDYSTYLDTIRNRDMLYEDLIQLIDDDLNKLNKLKQKYYTTTIPEKCTKLYASYDTVLKSYESYAENFKYTVTIEKVKYMNDDINIDAADSLYKSASLKLSVFNDNYNEFIEQYKQFKKQIVIQ